MGLLRSPADEGGAEVFSPSSIDVTDLAGASERIAELVAGEGASADAVRAAVAAAAEAFVRALRGPAADAPVVDVAASCRQAGFPLEAIVKVYRALADAALEHLASSPTALDLASARAVNGALATVLGDTIVAARSASGAVAVALSDFAATADEARCESSSAAESADMVVMNVRMVSAMISQIQHGAQAVAGGTADARHVADAALAGVVKSDAQIQHLAKLGDQIRKIVRVISNIARETNMLALNAKIEAARDASGGRGFNVVAEEVKSLARQTAAAAEEIEERIAEIARATEVAASSMQETHASASRIHELVGQITEAVGEQQGLVDGVGMYITEAADSVDTIAQTIVRANERISAAIERSRTSLAETAPGTTG